MLSLLYLGRDGKPCGVETHHGIYLIVVMFIGMRGVETRAAMYIPVGMDTARKLWWWRSERRLSRLFGACMLSAKGDPAPEREETTSATVLSWRCSRRRGPCVAFARPNVWERWETTWVRTCVGAWDICENLWSAFRLLSKFVESGRNPALTTSISFLSISLEFFKRKIACWVCTVNEKLIVAREKFSWQFPWWFPWRFSWQFWWQFSWRSSSRYSRRFPLWSFWLSLLAPSNCGCQKKKTTIWRCSWTLLVLDGTCADFCRNTGCEGLISSCFVVWCGMMSCYVVLGRFVTTFLEHIFHPLSVIITFEEFYFLCSLVQERDVH